MRNPPALAARVFRAGTEYDLAVFDRLTDGEQAFVAPLRGDPTFYGLLRPKPGSARTVRTVDRATALLLLTLRSPGPLPFFVWQTDPETAQQGIVQLVLDGVLELEHAGRFVSGPAALAVLGGGAARAPRGRLSTLSRDALRYASRLACPDPIELSQMLYAYGREPFTPALGREWPDRAAVLDRLGAGPGSRLGHHLARHWDAAPEEPRAAWIVWGPRHRRQRRGGPMYKLYVSPSLAELRPAFEAVVDVLARMGAPDFKLGADAANLLRPDKLVAYFPDRDALHRTAEVLTDALRGVAAHGVPFTAEIAGEGLLSWGMDPADRDGSLPWDGHESWRLFVVRRLASALVAAQAAPAEGVAAWEFALERVRRDGLDVDTWTPSPALWATAAVAS